MDVPASTVPRYYWVLNFLEFPVVFVQVLDLRRGISSRELVGLVIPVDSGGVSAWVARTRDVVVNSKSSQYGPVWHIRTLL